VSETSTKPYLIRAIYDWCTDNGYTPYLSVQVDANTRVPMAYVKDGGIVLNISMDAVQNLQLGNEEISCGGRFGGVAHKITVPIPTVVGIFAKETGQGLAFQAQESGDKPELVASSDEPPEEPPPGGKPQPQGKSHLRVVK
jgi:stringent starvation protein B